MRVPSDDYSAYKPEHQPPFVVFEPVVIPVAMFPEPDHAPEIHAQVAYEMARDGDPKVDVWAGVDDPAPALGQSARGTDVRISEATARVIQQHFLGDAHTGPRTCNQPSHAEWFVARHPEYLSRDDAHR